MVTRSSRRLYSHLNRISEKPPPDAPYRGYKKRPPGKGSLAYKCQTPPGSERVFFYFCVFFYYFLFESFPLPVFPLRTPFIVLLLTPLYGAPFPLFGVWISCIYIFVFFMSFFYFVLFCMCYAEGFSYSASFSRSSFCIFFLMCVGVIIHRSVTEYFRFNSRTRKSCNEFELEMFLTCFEIVVSFSIIFRSAH